MEDKSIRNWHQLLGLFNISCGKEKESKNIDSHLDKANISRELHSLLNQEFLNIDEAKAIFLEDDRAVIKIEKDLFIEVIYEDDEMKCIYYDKPVISEVTFERNPYNSHPNKATYIDVNDKILMIKRENSMHKENLKNFIKQ